MMYYSNSVENGNKISNAFKGPLLSSINNNFFPCPEICWTSMSSMLNQLLTKQKNVPTRIIWSHSYLTNREHIHIIISSFVFFWLNFHH